MFKHIFINRLKVLLRDKTMMFWTLLFPIILATFFYLGLNNLVTYDDFKVIPVAVVDNEGYKNNEYFKTALEEASKGEDPLLKMTLKSEDSAIDLLKNNEIDGYILVGSSITLIVNDSGMNQNIIKSFIDSYKQVESTAGNIISENPQAAETLFASIGDRENYVKETPLTKSAPDNLLSYFYVLIAMACFYGANFGNNEITNIQANLSSLAARINVAPVHKFKTLMASLSASLAIHFTELLILLAYIIFILKIDFGTRTGLVLLTTFIGSIAGISFGAFVSALIKKDENVKTGILIGTIMFCSFLAGMMYQNMIYIIAKNVPILSYLNPVNLLTDAFYSLYYYDTLTRYSLNMVVLVIFILFFWFATYMLIRRRKYASI